MNLPSPDGVQILLTLGSLAVAIVALRKVIVPTWRWCGRKRQRASDLIAVFIGRPRSYDRVAGKVVEEIPSLVDALVLIREDAREQGVKVTTAIDNLTSVVTQVANQQIILNEHTGQIADLRLGQAVHTEQIGLLKAASGERTAIHEETAKLFDMVAKRDSAVIDEEESR